MAAENVRVVVWAGTGGISASVFSWVERVVPGALPVSFVAGVLDRLEVVLGRSVGIVCVESLSRAGWTRVDWFMFRRSVVVGNEM